MARRQQVARCLLKAPIQGRKDDTSRRVSRFAGPNHEEGGVPNSWSFYNTFLVL
jgi:hypothetical protein